MTGYSFTAAAMLSDDSLTSDGGTLLESSPDAAGNMFAMIEFADMFHAASFVEINSIASYTHIKNVIREFDQKVTVQFAVTAYQNAADEVNSYDPASGKTREEQYIDAHYRRIIAERAERQSLMTADGCEITIGGRYWDNNLDLVEVTEVKRFSEVNQNTHETSWWHRTKLITRYDGTPGDGRQSDSDNSRLAKYHPVTRAAAQ